MSRKVAVCGLRLDEGDLSSLSAFLANCSHVSCLELINCQLNTSRLKVFAEGLRGSKVQIDVLDVSFNRNLRKESLPYLHEICLRTCGLNYWQCGFKQVDLLTFDADQNTDAPVASTEEEDVIRLYEDNAVLDLSKSTVQNYGQTLQRLLKNTKEEGLTAQITGYLDDDDITTLTAILRNARNISQLEISESTFSTGQIETIGKSIDGEIKVVNIFLCSKIDAEAWLALGEVARNHQTSTLLLTATGLTGPKLENLQLYLYPQQLTKLDLSRNEDLDEKSLRTLGNFVANANVRELIMAYCRLSPFSTKTLQNSMSTAKLKRFDVSGNTALGNEGFTFLGCIVENCSVEQLDISECNPDGDHMRSLGNSLDKAKIFKLNVSRNRNLRQNDGMKAITRIVRKSHLQELFMRQCDLDKDCLTIFKDTMGTTKIPRLDLGHYFMKGRPVTDEEIDVIIELLPRISEQLTLNRWELSNAQRLKLQNALNQSQTPPNIQLDRSVDDILRRRSS